MSNENNISTFTDMPNPNFEQDMKMQKLREELAKSFANYQKTMMFLLADAPLGVLCLPTVIENILLAHGCLRVYDLFNVDFVDVKGLGEARIRELTTRLDQFFSML